MDPEKGGKLQKLETKYQSLMKLRDQYKSLGGQTSREALNKIDSQLEQIENIYAAANVKRTDFTGADLPPKVIYTSRSHEWSTTKLKDLITKQTIKQNPDILK